MTRIPYPIPEPERTWLMEAGKIACRDHDRHAHEAVQEILDGIVKRYGIKEEA